MGMNVITKYDSKLIVKSCQNLFGLGMLGTKAGMTTWHMPSGEAVPCTVISFEDWNIITQIKNEKVNGYCAIQLGYLSVKIKKTSKSEPGHFKKTSAPALKYVIEYRIENLKIMKL